MKIQKTPNSQSNLEEEKKRTGVINLLDLRLNYKATEIKMVPAQNINIDQCNKIKCSDINSYTYGHIIFDKGGKNIQWRKDRLFNKWCWENWTAMCKRMKLKHLLIPLQE